MKWCRTYNSGDFTSVIQTSDGRFLATGYTFSTRNVNNPNSWVSGIRGYAPGQSGVEKKELYYNPNGSNADAFGTPCYPALEHPINAGSFLSHTRISLVKTDANGKIEWNYQYGYEDFAGQGTKAYRQSISWVDLVEVNGIILALCRIYFVG